jgi:hypothetical protein
MTTVFRIGGIVAENANATAETQRTQRQTPRIQFIVFLLGGCLGVSAPRRLHFCCVSAMTDNPLGCEKIDTRLSARAQADENDVVAVDAGIGGSAGEVAGSTGYRGAGVGDGGELAERRCGNH